MADVASAANELVENTQHLQGYIEYYKKLDDPGYAVLITGNWGAGKTHQVTKILKEEEYTYVSLFGAQTAEEVYSSVYAKMFPGKAFSKEMANSTEGVTLGPIAFGGLISNIAKAVLKDEVDNSKILIFDDLERSSLKTNELFGVFNKYIEHHKCRVIVLAHDKKVSDDLKATKEKVFGQTIEIVPQTSQAFDSFVSSLSCSQASSLLHNLKDTILGVFDQSETHSLRILKHSIEDLARLLGLLTDVQKEHQEAMSVIVGLFLALSLEVRSGRLDESSLVKRYDAIITYHMRGAKENVEVPPIYVANQRYPSIDLSSSLLKDRDLVNLLIKGFYSRKDIQQALEESVFFSKTTDLPAWLAFINFDNISDKESGEAANKLIDQFNQRSLTETGELLHLFSLRFLLSQMRLIDDDYEGVEAGCKTYLDELLEQDKLVPYMGSDLMWGEGLMSSYNGHGYWVEDSYKLHFQRIVEYLKDSQIKAGENKLPEYGRYLLGLVSADGEKFSREISLTFSGGNTFASIPALLGIDPSDFVQEWMGSSARNWQPISRGLEHRYSAGQLTGGLRAELKWIKEVMRLMDMERKKASGIRKKRIERAIRPSLRAEIEAL